MELSEKEIEEFKEQIIQQIDSSFPEDKKEFAIEKINSMNKNEFVEFLKNNNLLVSDNKREMQKISAKENPFRLIAEGKIPAHIIDENKDCIAVLEINPISKGHIIIIPKKALLESSKIPKSILSLAKRISRKIESKLKPREILITPSYVLGETIINVLPIYSNESLESPRIQAQKEELENLKNILGKKQKEISIKKPKIKKIEELKMWFPKRIP